MTTPTETKRSGTESGEAGKTISRVIKKGNTIKILKKERNLINVNEF